MPFCIGDMGLRVGSALSSTTLRTVGVSLVVLVLSGALVGCKKGPGQGQSAKQGEPATVATDTVKYRLIGIDNHIIQPRMGDQSITNRIAKCVVKRSGSNVYIHYDGKAGETWAFIPLSHTINFDAAQQSAAQSETLSAPATEANLTFDGTPDAIRIDLYEGAIAQHVPTGNVRFDFATTAK